MITTTDQKQTRTNWLQIRAKAIEMIRLAEKELQIPPAKSALVTRRERRKVDSQHNNSVN